MHALPSAFFHQVSSAVRIFVPRAWIAKSTIVVVPPIAAALVPVSKSSADFDPAEWHVEMRMRIDPARQHKQPRRIDHFVRRARLIPARTSLITAPSINRSALTLASAFTIVPF